MLAAIVVKLFDLQIIDGDKYLKTASSRMSTSIVNKAPRGDILDRYGNVLVTNDTGYSVIMQKTTNDNAQINNIISGVVDIIYSTGNKTIDTLPISLESPYEFIFKDENSDGSTEDEKNNWFVNNKHTGEYIHAGMRAEDDLYAYMQMFEVQGDFFSPHLRCIVGVRYEADKKNFSTVNPVTVAENINVEAVIRIKEMQDVLKGIQISEDYVRVYNKPGFATHILGRIGKISAEEYQANSSKGYGMNDNIGKQGIER